MALADRIFAAQAARQDAVSGTRREGREADSRPQPVREVSFILVGAAGGEGKHVGRNPVGIFDGKELAAERAPACERRGGSVPDGGRKGPANGGFGGPGRAGPFAGRTYVAGGGGGAAANQPGAARRSRAIHAVYPAATGDAGKIAASGALRRSR